MPGLSDRLHSDRFTEKHCRAAVPAAHSENGVLAKRPTIRDRVLPRKVQRTALVLASFILPQIASADWQVASADRESSPVAGIEHRHIVLQDSGERVTIDLAFFSPKSAMLRVIDNPGGSENLADAMAQQNLVAGVNGGYFDTDFRPLGLRVIDGKTRSPLLRARLLTGVLCASSRDVEIFRLGEFSRKKKCDAAIECGPFLVDGVKPVRGLDRLRSARRTFVAVARGGDTALGISSSLSLAEIAGALGALPDFKIQRALNLDGGSSSAFWFQRKTGSAFSIPEEKTVRDFVAIAPR